MTVFLLGPAEWRGHPPIVIPAWVGELLPPTWRPPTKRLRPLDLRVALVEACARAGHAAVVMETHLRRKDERHIALFGRIEAEAGIRQHFVIWPPRCKRAGLDVEIGNLLTRLDGGETLDVRLFVHPQAATIRHGEFVSVEKGSRSRYYSDLYEYGALLVRWHSVDELFQYVVLAAGTTR